MTESQSGPKNMTELADMLGVTATTVSLGLRNSPLISADMREKIRQLSEESGFKARNYRKRKPRSGRNSSGKFLILYDHTNTTDPVAQVILNSIMKRLSEHGLPFELCPSDDVINDPGRTAGVRGVLYHYCYNSETRDCLRGVPQVAIMHKAFDNAEWDIFHPDDTLAGRLVATYLIGQGFRNFALMWSRRWGYAEHLRLQGFRGRLRQSGMEWTEFAYDETEPPSLYLERFRGLLAEHGNRLGIFAFCDQVAYKACMALDSLGIERKPRQLELVSCDNTSLIQELHPAIPVVDLNIAEIATRGVDGLLWRLENPDASYQNVMLKPKLIIPADMPGQ